MPTLAMLREARRILDVIGPVVYAVQTPDGIKIGHTTNLTRRLVQLGVGVEDILGFMRGTREDEQAIHESLAEYAVRGREWYAPAPDVLDVVALMRADLRAWLKDHEPTPEPVRYGQAEHDAPHHGRHAKVC